MNGVLGLYDVVKANAVAFQQLFVSGNSTMCRTSFKRLLKYAYSEVGDNNRQKEQDTVYAWEMLLQTIEGSPKSNLDCYFFIW